MKPPRKYKYRSPRYVDIDPRYTDAALARKRRLKERQERSEARRYIESLMPRCCMGGCGTLLDGSEFLHRLPEESSCRRWWLQLCYCSEAALPDAVDDVRVCGKHFTPADYSSPGQLREDILPSRQLPTAALDLLGRLRRDPKSCPAPRYLQQLYPREFLQEQQVRLVQTQQTGGCSVSLLSSGVYETGEAEEDFVVMPPVDCVLEDLEETLVFETCLQKRSYRCRRSKQLPVQLPEEEEQNELEQLQQLRELISTRLAAVDAHVEQVRQAQLERQEAMDQLGARTLPGAAAAAVPTPTAGGGEGGLAVLRDRLVDGDLTALRHWDWDSMLVCPDSLTAARRVIHTLRADNLSLRARLLQRCGEQHETQLQLLRAETLHARRELIWRRRLEQLFSRCQLKQLVDRWSNGPLREPGAVRDWLRPGPIWEPADYLLAIELRSACTASGFQLLRTRLQYPLPSLLAIRSAALCGVYPRVAAAFTQLCQLQDVCFKRDVPAASRNVSLEQLPEQLLCRPEQLLPCRSSIKQPRVRVKPRKHPLSPSPPPSPADDDPDWNWLDDADDQRRPAQPSKPVSGKWRRSDTYTP